MIKERFLFVIVSNYVPDTYITNIVVKHFYRYRSRDRVPKNPNLIILRAQDTDEIHKVNKSLGSIRKDLRYEVATHEQALTIRSNFEFIEYLLDFKLQLESFLGIEKCYLKGPAFFMVKPSGFTITSAGRLGEQLLELYIVNGLEGLAEGIKKDVCLTFCCKTDVLKAIGRKYISHSQTIRYIKESQKEACRKSEIGRSIQLMKSVRKTSKVALLITLLRKWFLKNYDNRTPIVLIKRPENYIPGAPQVEAS